jgi:plasmid stabilization system protein ParE
MTKEAVLRLQEIDNFISKDKPTVAIEFVDNLIIVAETLSDNPEKGRVVPGLSLSLSY